MNFSWLKKLISYSAKITLLFLILPVCVYVALPILDGRYPEVMRFWRFLVLPLFFNIPYILMIFGMSFVSLSFIWIVIELLDHLLGKNQPPVS